MSNTEFFATCATGLAGLLADELKSLAVGDLRQAGAGVKFVGGLDAGYRVCLHSRLANRVLLPLHSGPAATPEALYARVRELDWAEHLDVDGTLAVDLFTAHSAITHSQFGALKVKDAVVDQFRDAVGRRPSVERDTPDVRINVYLYRDRARIALDLSGSSLHRRGYRDDGGAAPLKENLAAALLHAMDWPQRVDAGEAFADPLCGSGTLLIEAAMIACRRAPGLTRKHFGFLRWKGHDETLWQTLLDEAQSAVRPSPVPVVGGDREATAVEAARRHAEAAGVSTAVRVEHCAIDAGRLVALQDSSPGLVLTNPPYGERLAAGRDVYANLGTAFASSYDGWQCAVFTARAAPAAAMKLPLRSVLDVRNGGIDCVLLTGRIPGLSRLREPTGIDVTPFANRVKKNQRSLQGWLKQARVRAWRSYDAELPDFSMAIDVYTLEDGERHLVVQEYRAPATINAVLAQARLDVAVAALPAVLDVSLDNIHVKVRERQTGSSQYQPSEIRRNVGGVLEELGGRLEVNFSDYLDTGVFLDHRKVRQYLRDNARDKRFLNLFAYTAAATVAAVVGGARSSVSVDLSNRYCRWAERNLALNGADANAHLVVRRDVATWLAERSGDTRFDLILLDPPTFSNSTDLPEDWDVQRDHAAMIEKCLDILAADGTLVFSNNFRRFRLDASLEQGRLGPHRVSVEERSRWSLSRDFARNPRIHRVWFIRHASSSD